MLGGSLTRVDRVERAGDFRSSVGLRGSTSGRGFGAGTMSGDGRNSLFHSGFGFDRGGVARADRTSDTMRGGYWGLGAVAGPLGPCGRYAGGGRCPCGGI